MSARSGGGLERGACLELEALLPIPFLGLERDRIAELERTDRRVPRHTHARRIAERFVAGLRAVRPDLAGVDEHAAPHGLLALHDRIEDFGVADDLAPAAQRVAEFVARAE